MPMSGKGHRAQMLSALEARRLSLAEMPRSGGLSHPFGRLAGHRRGERSHGVTMFDTSHFSRLWWSHVGDVVEPLPPERPLPLPSTRVHNSIGEHRMCKIDPCR